MKGFDDKALILFPLYEHYVGQSAKYKQQFRMAYANLMKYLSNCNIEPISFYTDDVARKLALEGTRWATPLTLAESFFASKKCEGMGNAMYCTYDFPELMAEAEKKYPTNLDASDDVKLSNILQHVQYVTERAIPKYKIVINFKFGNRSQYKIDNPEGEAKIRIIIDSRSFIAKTFIGGCEEECTTLLGVPYANQSLDNWGLV